MKYSSSSSSATLLTLLMATVQGSPLNFPGSSVVSLSSRVPNPCLTTAGETCVFPFLLPGGGVLSVYIHQLPHPVVRHQGGPQWDCDHQQLGRLCQHPALRLSGRVPHLPLLHRHHR